ncbi:MAG TPA: CHAP domain-containing protein [Glaciihabitans sp.]|nr:CHAP domain-containing protein [Glaciihabitans sp.]
MPEEPTSDQSDDLLAASDATPFIASNASQYSSRRELRAAVERESKSKNAAPNRVSRVSKVSAESDPITSRHPVAIASVKPSRAERAAARRLTAPEPTPAGSVPPSLTAKKKQNPVAVMLTLLLVPGFIASASLPAFAFAPAGSEHEAAISQQVSEATEAALPSQALAVADTAAGAKTQKSSITATSEEELVAQQVAAAALASYQAAQARAAAAAATGSTGTLSGTVSSPRVAGDDYPWPSAGNTLSPLNYYYRQCVDFVAWRLNRDAGSTGSPWKYVWSNLTPTGGNASAWKSAWESHGWVTSNTPVVGAVAWFNGNHVAYVKEVVGSNVIIEEYNGMAKLAYAIRTIPSSSVAKFLYPPPR